MPDGKGYEVIFDGVSSTTIPEFICHEVKRSLVGSNRNVLVDVPGKEGAWLFVEKRGNRRIEIEASVLTLNGSSPTYPGARRDALTAVADWLDLPGYRKLEIGDRPGIYYLAVLDTAVDVEEWRHLGKMKLSFSCEPYAYENSITTWTSADDLSGTPITFTFADKVDAYPIVDVLAVGGNIPGFALEVNGYQLECPGVLLSGATRSINSLAYVVINGPNSDTTLNGTIAFGSVLMPDGSGSFPVLRAGNNPQTVRLVNTSGATGTATITMKWRRRVR